MIIFIHYVSNTSYSQELSDISYEFSKTDSSYSFKGSFKTKRNPLCILNLCFDIKHVSALAPDAKDVVLITEESNRNQISYTYRKFIYFENKTLWNRILNKDSLRLDFYLISSDNNSALMPKIISSTGYYLISPAENCIKVEYYQHCILTESSLTSIYINKVRKEAINFIHRFNKYSESECKGLNQ